MTERARTALWLAALAAVSANAVEAIADPDGGVWEAARFALATLFALALVAALAAALHGRRSGTMSDHSRVMLAMRTQNDKEPARRRPDLPRARARARRGPG